MTYILYKINRDQPRSTGINRNQPGSTEINRGLYLREASDGLSDSDSRSGSDFSWQADNTDNQVMWRQLKSKRVDLYFRCGAWSAQSRLFQKRDEDSQVKFNTRNSPSWELKMADAKADKMGTDKSYQICLYRNNLPSLYANMLQCSIVYVICQKNSLYVNICTTSLEQMNDPPPLQTQSMLMDQIIYELGEMNGNWKRNC